MSASPPSEQPSMGAFGSTFSGFIPSLPPLAAPVLPTNNNPLLLSPGQQVEDFQVIAVLGRGAFGVVYLAWQSSLGRQVALKISPAIGQEGRTLARLDHPHIVRVYAESVREGHRLLCMQYVPSVALDDLLRELSQNSQTWTGQALLDAVDRRHAFASEFDPQQLQDRQRLSELDHVDAACWITARLAEALDHAHRHQVLHRDLKPGNVLISQYGRPMLVDFNLADVTREADSSPSLIGGTLPYMSPEHLQAFQRDVGATPIAVTQQSDIYSLGVMLYELLVGRLPFPSVSGQPLSPELIARMLQDRRNVETALETSALHAEPAVQAVMRKLLAFDPAQRWKSADELAQGLIELSALRQAVRSIPDLPVLPDWYHRHPFFSLTLVGIGPHLLASLFNIPYNLQRVISLEQRPTFFQLVNWYNVLLYPFCVALCVWLVWPVFRFWRSDQRDLHDIDRIRNRVLKFPKWAAYIALLGWLPGILWFPYGLREAGMPLSWMNYMHLLISVGLSGLIALTYSVQSVLMLTMCLFYPRLWIDPTQFREKARREIEPLRNAVRLLPMCAGAIPLISAVLLIDSSPESFTVQEPLTFKILTTGLIVLGMIGFQLSVLAGRYTTWAIDLFSLPVRR